MGVRGDCCDIELDVLCIPSLAWMTTRLTDYSVARSNQWGRLQNNWGQQIIGVSVKLNGYNKLS